MGTYLFLYEFIFNPLYDGVFYPFMIVTFGIVKGGAIAVLGSLISCAFLFWLYDRMSVDWLGANALRQMEKKQGNGRLVRLLIWIGKEKNGWERILSPIVFIQLTLPLDPLIVAVHYRRKHFEGITWRDWGVLVAAVAAANTWWLLKIGLLIEGIRFVWGKYS